LRRALPACYLRAVRRLAVVRRLGAALRRALPDRLATTFDFALLLLTVLGAFFFIALAIVLSSFSLFSQFASLLVCPDESEILARSMLMMEQLMAR
jgi:hypothetical protein